MRVSRRLLALSAAAAIVAGGWPRRVSGASPHSEAIQQSREMLDQVLQLYPGTAVAVAVGDDIVWSTAFGYSDVDRHRPAGRSTQFRIYEVAMPLTATVMARLAEEGRFDMDAPIQRYLPEIPETRAVVTGRKLAAHLAGAGDFGEDELAIAPCVDARQAVRTLNGRLFTRPAGLGHSMSRQGYMLLSAALEAATGRRYSDLLNEIIAGPAGMSSTMSDDPRRFLPGRTLFYERGFLGLLRTARDVDTSCLWGGGGLLSTTEDLVRFGAALLRGQLLRQDSIEAMFTPQKTRNGADTGYGLGWFVETDARGRPFVWHGGRGIGGRSAIVIVPHARLVAVMLSNIEGERLDEHARRIAGFFLESAEAGGVAPDLRRATRGGPSQPPFAYRAVPAPGE
jgi:CubicO group peptidase (beta-lactamase class C family)